MLTELAFAQNRKIVFYITMLKKKGGEKIKIKQSQTTDNPTLLSPKDGKYIPGNHIDFNRSSATATDYRKFLHQGKNRMELLPLQLFAPNTWKNRETSQYLRKSSNGNVSIF